MMKTTSKIGIVTTLFLGLAFASRAQTTAPAGSSTGSSSSGNEWRLSVGPEVGLPIAGFSNAYSWYIGGSAQLDIPVANKLYVTVNAGYEDLMVKNGEFPGRNLQLIPAKAGLKYFLLDNFLYVQAQAGATFLGNKTDALADKSAGFTYSPQVGVLLKIANKNYIDVGFRYEQVVNGFYNGGTNLSTLGLRVAYTFGL